MGETRQLCRGLSTTLEEQVVLVLTVRRTMERRIVTMLAK